MAIAVLSFVLLYVVVLIGATVLGYQLAKRRGWPSGKRWSAAAVGFLMIFLPMFWDWLPTVWLHSYYCDKDAGITVSKTPEQWAKDNPDVGKSLIRQEPPKLVATPNGDYIQLNQRIRRERERLQKPLWLEEYQHRIVDNKNGETLVRLIDFGTGQTGRRIEQFRDIKVWMYRNSCEADGQSTRRKEFNRLSAGFETLGGSQ